MWKTWCVDTEVSEHGEAWRRAEVEIQRGCLLAFLSELRFDFLEESEQNAHNSRWSRELLKPRSSVDGDSVLQKLWPGLDWDAVQEAEYSTDKIFAAARQFYAQSWLKLRDQYQDALQSTYAVLHDYYGLSRNVKMSIDEYVRLDRQLDTLLGLVIDRSIFRDSDFWMLLAHCFRFLRTHTLTFFTIEHIITSDAMFPIPHQTQFDLILNVFDMDDAA